MLCSHIPVLINAFMYMWLSERLTPWLTCLFRGFSSEPVWWHRVMVYFWNYTIAPWQIKSFNVDFFGPLLSLWLLPRSPSHCFYRRGLEISEQGVTYCEMEQEWGEWDANHRQRALLLCKYASDLAVVRLTVLACRHRWDGFVSHGRVEILPHSSLLTATFIKGFWRCPTKT